jgi:nucleoid DNA-binding protein
MTAKMSGKEAPKIISKDYLVYYIFKKINNIANDVTSIARSNVKRDNIRYVINVLFDEILKDISQGKPLNIFNFANLTLMHTAPRRHFCFHTQRMQVSKGYNKLKFIMNPKFKRILLKNVDIRSIDGYNPEIDKK